MSLPIQPSRCHLQADSTSRYWKRRRREILYLYQINKKQKQTVWHPTSTWWIGRVAEERWSEVEQIIQGKSTEFCLCPLVVTAAGIRASESCNTLLEIVGFTASDACDFMFRFFITREMAQKLSNQLEKEIFSPNSKCCCCCCWDVVTSLPVQPSRCHLWADSASRFWKRRRRQFL